mgnify:CR=1 FL=1
MKEYTQVNYEELQNLITSMRKAETSCGTSLKSFTNVMNGLADSGRIEGTSVSALKANMEKINKLQSEFESYCEEVIKEINTIITSEKEIEEEFSQEYNELLDINPEEYAG